jgi:hypothetical protein
VHVLHVNKKIKTAIEGTSEYEESGIFGGTNLTQKVGGNISRIFKNERSDALLMLGMRLRGGRQAEIARAGGEMKSASQGL